MKKLAFYISTIGHPLLTLPVFSVIVFFTYETFQKALLHSLLIVAGIAIPLAIKMYRNTKKGTYTNFDVSDQTQRQSWYIFAIAVLGIVTIILFVTHQPRGLRTGILFSLILLVISKLLNYFIKSSLHVSLNIYLACIIFSINRTLGLGFFGFTILIAWARVALMGHTVKEIIAGSIIGLTTGILYLWCV